MKFKTYKSKKINNYFKNSQLLFVFNGLNQRANTWISTEQNLKTKNLLYYQVYIKLLHKVLKNSKFKNIFKNLNGPIFFLYSKKKHFNIKKKSLNNLTLSLLIIKMYNNAYLLPQTKTLTCFNYKITIKTLYQFLLVNLKFMQTFK